MFPFDNTYARLPDRFYARVAPTPVRAPRMVKVNRALAERLGVDGDRLASDEGAQALAGNVVPQGAEPIALAYAGHQFGAFVPQLGDGRAILLGEVVGKDGRRDVQLKGAGVTPFSRGGDGRAALGPVLREYIVSESMAAMGIPTTRSLAAVMTGERVFREEPLPGAILTRVAASHIRVGTFQYFAARRDKEALGLLTMHALGRHYPDASGDENAALALLERVAVAQANLVASWLGVGFIHGVMNTDNCTVSGETIDYGPCAFLDEFDPTKKFSSIDHGGRYAFGNQPRIAQWNLARLAEALLPLVADTEEDSIRLATETVEAFGPAFETAYARVLGKKLGFASEGPGDVELADDLLARLAANAVDYTVFFRRLCASAADAAADANVASLFGEPDAFHGWAALWRKRLAEEATSPEERAAAMRRANPAFIPRNHRVEQAIASAVEHDDFAPFERLVDVLAKPFDDQPEHAELANPPAAAERVQATFCGT
jgi:serine/tyrosine/threonine adenylyltransferase